MASDSVPLATSSAIEEYFFQRARWAAFREYWTYVKADCEERDGTETAVAIAAAAICFFRQLLEDVPRTLDKADIAGLAKRADAYDESATTGLRENKPERTL